MTDLEELKKMAEAKPVALAYRFEPDLPWHAIEHAWQAPKKSDWPDIEIVHLYSQADYMAALSEAAALREEVERLREAAEWKPISTAPRDGSYVWLWNKNVENPWEAPQQFRWSTHYSVFGLGGCWTDGLCTMGDGIDFDFWCAVLPAKPSNPYEALGSTS